MTATTGQSETWQARISHEMAAQLRDAATFLGLEGRTAIVKAALDRAPPAGRRSSDLGAPG